MTAFSIDSDDDLLGDNPTDVTTPQARPQAPTQNHFPDVTAFVEVYLSQVYARHHHATTPFKWCPWWHRHPEAYSRLTALWQAFEALRLDPGVGGATWWTTYADPIMTELTSPTGPFHACSTEKHTASKALPTVAANTKTPAGR
ncbi:DUF4913 domain-containing protein [Solicola sp. PLA-1-18]|uniref:DUF4913 domain-containing protein n=1 Tax=Solicola sp. PLA-1-18 TaxID=3380532 RepID=UPI003B7A1885